MSCLDVDPAAGLADDALDGRESQSCAVLSLGGDEWLEYAVDYVLGDPYAGVSDGYLDIPAGLRVVFGCLFDLAVELAREERSERWLLVRQVAIVLVLVAMLLTHALLWGGGM
jgi:hypothetical protein